MLLELFYIESGGDNSSCYYNLFVLGIEVAIKTYLYWKERLSYWGMFLLVMGFMLVRNCMVH